MAEALSRSADYRVLRRLIPRTICPTALGPELRTAILLDTETTGLDHARDEIIELGMVKFDYRWSDGTDVLVDVRELKPLPDDAQSVMVQTQAKIKAAGLVRSCVILNRKILTMQFERLAKESEIFSFQRYVDASANADYEGIALEWITKGTGPLARE